MRAAHLDEAPLLELTSVTREYQSGTNTVKVLQEVNLSIAAGEMVAIVGASGSGKSTLLNLLGCLDQPTSGTYRVAGQLTQGLDANGCAQLRREHFGFVFQRYELLPKLTALGNVETPAIYAGCSRTMRCERAQALLDRLGLHDRLHYRPAQLSGGQQQRVSIARALMNGGRIILADEPTGALDIRSGHDLLALFAELNAQGHTIIIVTHDPDVAKHAHRVIEISDGHIVGDRINRKVQKGTSTNLASFLDARPVFAHARRGSVSVTLSRLGEAWRVALLSAGSHRMRTLLTMLGIIIGIASVVCTVALGEGSRQRILKQIASVGTSTIDIYPGRGFGDQRAGTVHSLNIADVEALRAQTYVDSVTPVVSVDATLRYANESRDAQVQGVGDSYFRVHGIQMKEGVAFDANDLMQQSQVVVVGEQTRTALLGTGPSVGQVILVGPTPCRVIGVAQTDRDIGGRGSLHVWMPYTSVMSRMTGQFDLQSATVRISDNVSTDAAMQGVSALLLKRHGRRDFNLLNIDAVRELLSGTSQNLTLLISSIALISLLVGGIGVMNIMLVSVTERTHEIGVRIAVGARQADIRNQFLIEAVVICLGGGMLGIVLALGIGMAFSGTAQRFQMIFSVQSIIAAFLTATLIGVISGFMPAHRAGRLDPVEALARE